MRRFRLLAPAVVFAAVFVAGAPPAVASTSPPPAGTTIDASNAASVPGAYDLADGRVAVPLRPRRPRG